VLLILRRRSPGAPACDRLVSWIVVALALAIGLPWLDVANPQGLAFRIRIAAFVPLALASAIALGSLRLPALVRDATGAALALVLVVIAGQQPRTEGEVVTHPALVSAAIAVADYAPPGATLIVPERHIEFMIAWYARVPVAAHPDQIPYTRRVRAMPLHFIGADSELDRALDAARKEPGLAPPIGVHGRHPNGRRSSGYCVILLRSPRSSSFLVEATRIVLSLPVITSVSIALPITVTWLPLIDTFVHSPTTSLIGWPPVTSARPCWHSIVAGTHAWIPGTSEAASMHATASGCAAPHCSMSSIGTFPAASSSFSADAPETSK
jgi:hypothetical protein